MSHQWVPAAGVIGREMEGQMVLISPTNGKIRVLNATGAMIWQALKAGKGREAIVDEIVAAFGITAESARSDFDRFLADLCARNLLIERTP